MPWCLYLLECNNGAYYAGITNNLVARFTAHQSGKGARYTRANPPIKIVASKSYVDRSSASIAEAQLKNLPRNKKIQYFEEAVNQTKMNKADLMIAVQAAQNGDWETAHHIAQDYSDTTANWLHAVLHKIEGDVGNSHYWYAKTVDADAMTKHYEDFNNVHEELIAIHHSLK